MHHIYHTDALIISFENTGEADRVYLLYTKDIGFIYAKAIGVRFEKSKLRFALQPYVLARVALVKGKAIWRITTAMPASHFFGSGAPLYAYEVFQNVTGIIKDLVPVEISDSRVFDDLRNAFLCMGIQTITSEKIKDIELCLMLRVLHYLGYVSENSEYGPILESNFSFHTFGYDHMARSSIVKAINSALFATTG